MEDACCPVLCLSKIGTPGRRNSSAREEACKLQHGLCVLSAFKICLGVGYMLSIASVWQSLEMTYLVLQSEELYKMLCA